MTEKLSRKKWDTEGLAVVGTFCGFLAGGVHEVGEVFLHDSSEIEFFGQIVGEIVAAALGGAFLFATVSALRNRLKSDP
jgi:drug/metabolite transporter (DMT)-like permease